MHQSNNDNIDEVVGDLADAVVVYKKQKHEYSDLGFRLEYNRKFLELKEGEEVPAHLEALANATANARYIFHRLSNGSVCNKCKYCNSTAPLIC
jgi:hypothetical protein